VVKAHRTGERVLSRPIRTSSISLFDLVGMILPGRFRWLISLMDFVGLIRLFDLVDGFRLVSVVS
jgi:hypothetical protein